MTEIDTGDDRHQPLARNQGAERHISFLFDSWVGGPGFELTTRSGFDHMLPVSGACLPNGLMLLDVVEQLYFLAGHDPM